MKKKSVKKVFLATDLCVIVAVLAAGCVLLPFGSGWRELGYVIISCGLSMIPFFLHGYRIEGHPGTFRLEDIPVSRENQDTVLTFLNGETTELDVRHSEQGGAVVSLYSRKNGGEILAQYFDYAQMLNGVEFPIRPITSEQRDKLKQAFAKK